MLRGLGILLAPATMAASPFDLRTLPPPAADTIVVTAQRDDLKFRLDPKVGQEPPSQRLTLNLGGGVTAHPDTQQGRLGDAQLMVRLKIPF